MTNGHGRGAAYKVSSETSSQAGFEKVNQTAFGHFLEDINECEQMKEYARNLRPVFLTRPRLPCQIHLFWPFRRDCTGPGSRDVLLIGSKNPVTTSIIYKSCNIKKLSRSEFEKNENINFNYFDVFFP